MYRSRSHRSVTKQVASPTSHPTAFAIVSLLMLVSILWGCGGEQAATPTAVSAPTTAPAAPTATTAAPAASTATSALAAATATTGNASAAGVKIGLSFSDFATERWKNEEQ